jgi:hypothetical protein
MSVPRNLHLVFSAPPPEIGDEMYNAWYDYHVYEILRTPGYEAVRRYELTRHTGTREPASKRFVSVYAIGDDLPQMATNLAAERSNMDLPRWFGGIRFASWVAELRPGCEPPVLADRLYFVFGSAPQGVSPAQYPLGEEPAERSWRFRLSASTPDGSPAMTDLALYQLADRVDKPASGAVTVPDWLRRVDGTAVEGRAIGDRIESA